MTPRSGTVLLAIVVVTATIAGVGVAQSAGVVTGSPELDVQADPTAFDPGTEADLRLTVSNAGNLRRGGPTQYEDRVVTARGVSVDVRDGSTPFDVEGDPVAVGDVSPGTTQVDGLEVTVPEGVEPGRYRVPVTVSYRYTAAVEYSANSPPEYQDLTREVTRYLTLRVRERAHFAVVDTETTAQVGDTGSLTVTVENVGRLPARDATLTLSSSSDELSFGSGSTASTGSVGAWDPGENATLNYTVAVRDDAALRRYSLTATVEYEDVDGIARESDPMTIGVSPEREQAFALRNVTANLRVGEEGRFAGTVVNRGPNVARRPVVTFRPTATGIDAGSSEYALDTLAPGESDNFSFDVTVSESGSAAVRQFNLTVRYRNRRGDVRASDPLERRVEVRPRRDRFGVEAVDPTVVAGEASTLQLRVTNRGDDPLRDVRAKAFVQSPLSSDDDEAIVPALAPGESATITVGLSASGAALEKDYPVSVDFQYELPDGDTRVSRTYRVPVTVERKEGGESPVPPAAVGAAAVGVLGLALLSYRRRRRGDG